MQIQTITERSNYHTESIVFLTFLSLIIACNLFAQSTVEDFTVGYYRELLSHVKENTHDYDNIKLNMGVAQTIEGDWEGARNTFLELRSSQNKIIALHNLVLTDLVLGKVEEAKEIIASIKEIGSGHGGEGLEKLIGLSTDEVKAAIFLGGTVRDPKNWRAYARLGSIQAKLNRFPEATESYKKAVELHNDEADLHNALGEAYGKLGQLEKASECFQKAIGLDNKFSKAYTNSGVVYGKMGKYAEAIVALNHAAKLGSSDPMNFYALGQCYLLTGHKDSASTIYEKLKTLDIEMANKLRKRIEQ